MIKTVKNKGNQMFKNNFKPKFFLKLKEKFNVEKKKSITTLYLLSSSESSPSFTTFNEIFEMLKKLKLKGNTSPDEVPYFMVKKCAFLLAASLAKIINFTFLKRCCSIILETSSHSSKI